MIERNLPALVREDRGRFANPRFCAVRREAKDIFVTLRSVERRPPQIDPHPFESDPKVEPESDNILSSLVTAQKIFIVGVMTRKLPFHAIVRPLEYLGLLLLRFDDDLSHGAPRIGKLGISLSGIWLRAKPTELLQRHG